MQPKAQRCVQVDPPPPPLSILNSMDVVGSLGGEEVARVVAAVTKLEEEREALNAGKQVRRQGVTGEGRGKAAACHQTKLVRT